MVYWQNGEAGKITKESRCPGHDVSVRKIKARKCRFVEIKNRSSLSENVYPVFFSFFSAVGTNIPSRLKRSVAVHFTIRYSSEGDHKLGYHERSN